MGRVIVRDQRTKPYEANRKQFPALPDFIRLLSAGARCCALNFGWRADVLDTPIYFPCVLVLIVRQK